jgi:hypothetical protein
MDHGERLARVETALESLTETVNATAADVRAVRDHMLTTKGKASGWRALGSLVVGVGVVASGVGALAAVLVR